jgi:hypothetical protein
MYAQGGQDCRLTTREEITPNVSRYANRTLEELIARCTIDHSNFLVASVVCAGEVRL